MRNFSIDPVGSAWKKMRQKDGGAPLPLHGRGRYDASGQLLDSSEAVTVRANRLLTPGFGLQSPGSSCGAPVRPTPMEPWFILWDPNSSCGAPICRGVATKFYLRGRIHRHPNPKITLHIIHLTPKFSFASDFGHFILNMVQMQNCHMCQEKKIY